MKRLLCFLMALCLAAGLTAASLAEGQPWVNPELPGNLPVQRPGAETDFYLSVNYERHQQATWADVHSDDSLQSQTVQKMKDAIWSMVNTGESTEARVLRILTGLIMDGERRESEGTEPLTAFVRRVRETKSLDEFSALCREEGFLFGSPYVTLRLGKSRQDPEKFGIYFEPVQLVPTKQSQEDEPDPDAPVTYDTALVEKELLELGFAPERAKDLAERLETVQRRTDTAEILQDELADKPLTPAELRTVCTPIYDQMVSQGMVPSDGGITYQPSIYSAAVALQRLYTEENLELFQAIVCLSMLRYARDYLDPATYARAHEIDGAPDLKAAATDYMTGQARILTERAYADAYITPEQRDMVLALVEEYKQTLAERMRNCGWLSEESRNRAAEKALGIRTVLVVSEDRLDYAPLLEKLSEGSPSLLQAAVWYDQTDRQMLLRLAGKPFDRSHRILFDNSMLDANGIYEPSRNTIYLMAGILMKEFCNPASRETLLAGIGQTIGHEISHGFDPNGVQFDKVGEYNPVLTEEDQPKHQERVQRLIDGMSRIELADGVHVDGNHVIHEAAADLLGFRLTLDLAAKTEGFDYDLFFREFAMKYYRSYQNRERALEDYAGNYHPACYVRVNFTVAQQDEFYRTYPAVTEGTAMYYAPADRVCIW